MEAPHVSIVAALDRASHPHLGVAHGIRPAVDRYVPAGATYDRARVSDRHRRRAAHAIAVLHRDGVGPGALRADRRPPWSQAAAAGRLRVLHDRLAGLRASSFDREPDRATFRP